MKHFTCRICNNTFADEPFIAHETRNGWNDEFEYMRCPHCGTIQICNFPEDIDRYYASDYYSMKTITSKSHSNRISVLLRRNLLRYKTQKKGLIGKILNSFFKNIYLWVQPNMFNFDSKILDVGCGSGERILKMAQCGFYNVSGIDPYINQNISYRINNSHTIHVEKKQLDEVTEKYDMIMLHHVIEHLPAPHTAIQKISTLLNENGVLLLEPPQIPHILCAIWTQCRKKYAKPSR